MLNAQSAPQMHAQYQMHQQTTPAASAQQAVAMNPFQLLSNLLELQLPKQRHDLENNANNLENVAKYCEDTYFESKEPLKSDALKVSKSYTTQAVASIADQINMLASSFVELIGTESDLIAQMSLNLSQLQQELKIHQEKVARREIGALTTNKNIQRQLKVKKPDVEEKPVKYIRKPIDYSLLDDIGHGIKMTSRNLGRQSSYSSTHSSSGSDIRGAPTIKPPTPPMAQKSGHGSASGGTIRSSTSSSYYRPTVAPPSVPSEYLSRQELGIYASKKELNLSEHLAYGGARRPSQTSAEYSSGMDTMARRMTNPYMSQVSANNSQMSVGYASGKELGMRTNLNNIDYAFTQNGTVVARRSQQAGSGVYGRPSLSSIQAQMAADGPLMRQQSSSSTASQVHNLMQLPPPPEFLANEGGDDDTIAFVEEDHDVIPPWVPLERLLEKVVTTYGYVGLRDDELSFKENTVVYVLKKNDDHWYEGVMQDDVTGQIFTGLYPFNYARSVRKYVNEEKRSSEC